MRIIKKLALLIDDFGHDHGLVFHRKKIVANSQELLSALVGYSVHFSVKSFPHREFLKSISPFIHGWDISSESELALILPLLTEEHSLWLTNSDVKVLALALKHKPILNFTLDHTTDLSFDYPEGVKLGLRLDPLSLMGKGHSRYGYLLSDLASIPQALNKRIHYLHTHCPGVVTEKELRAMRAGMETIKEQFPHLKLMNLGGGLSRSNLAAFQSLQAEYPLIPLGIEPGRWFSESAGAAFSRIDSIFMKEGNLYLVGELSAEAHLKWARGVSYSFLGSGHEVKYDFKRMIFSSSNALETDQIILKDAEGSISLSVGSWLVIENIPGYSMAWNHEFNGVPKAEVIFID